MKNTNQIPIDEIRKESYYDTIEKIGEDTNTCFICGKRIKNISTANYIHIYTNGTIVSNEMPEDENSQGCFPIGPNCSKKLPKNFITK